MDFPWEFTIPVPGPWQEMQSTAAKRAGGIVDKPQIPNNAANSTIHRRMARFWGCRTFCRDRLLFGFTMGLFAE
jgi:hypothetical protein